MEDGTSELKLIKNKIVLLGDVSVGKTSIAFRFQKDDFTDKTQSTLGAAFITHTIVKDNIQFQFDIWDTAGQERFKSLGALYYKNARAAIVVYDITEQGSLERAKEWVSELNENADTDILVVLVGNKCDLSDSRSIKREEAEFYAKENGLLYYECSAKTGENVKTLFLDVMVKIPTKRESEDDDGLDLNDNADSSNDSQICSC